MEKHTATYSKRLIRKELDPKIKEINERIYTATIQLKEHKIHYISAYAPTLDKSEKDPKLRDDFYDALESVIDKKAKRDLLVIGGDFNAKTGSGYDDYPDNMGNLEKG